MFKFRICIKSKHVLWPKISYVVNKQIRSYSLENHLNISSDSVLEKFLKNLQAEFENLNENATMNKVKRTRMEYLRPIVGILSEQNRVLANMQSLQELSKNKELQELIEDEEILYKSQLGDLEERLAGALLANTEETCKGVVFELTAGVGGQEAMLFASDLYEMYCNYIAFKGWSYAIADEDNSDIGGIRHASLLVDGPQVYSHLKQEAGVHRVQRVPTTDKSGRIHTSTVTVAVIPQPDEVDIQLKPNDLRIETKRASGAGGQHVNTTDSAVRVVHIPTGTVVDCQTDRSQLKNREIAIQKLKAQLYQNQLNSQLAESQATRKSQVGSSLRNEKIRTYNYNQHRISDHRLQGESLFNLKGFLEGTELLDELISKLQLASRKKELQKEIDRCIKS